MAGRQLPLLIDEDTFERLQATSKRTGQTATSLAESLIEEGLRMEGHPGIVFRSGPAGRGPGLAGGPDVWEVARVLNGGDTLGDEEIQRAAALMDLTPDQAHSAVNYYHDYRDEIEDWIRRVDEEAAEAEAALHHGISPATR